MIEFLAGQSLLTTIDAPAVSHVSPASAREPLLGALLLLDARSIMQAAPDLDLPQPRREDSPRSVSVEVVDAALMDAFVRLVDLLGEPDMVPRLAPLVLQEITMRLLTGPRGAQLLHTKLDQLDAVTREAHPVMHASSIHELAGRVLDLMGSTRTGTSRSASRLVCVHRRREPLPLPSTSSQASFQQEDVFIERTKGGLAAP